VLGALAILLGVEFFADKIAVVDHINDIIQTFIRPAAGAILFAAEANVITDIHPALSLILGLLVAFGVHATKATARPFVTATTAGIGNPIVSVLEDIVSFLLALFAILAPFLLLFLFALLLYLAYRLWMRRRKPVPTGAAASFSNVPRTNWPR